MSIRLAIHYSEYGFSRQWIDYCRQSNIDHKVINGYASDVMDQLRDCNGLLWHVDHQRATDLLMARHVLQAAQQMGLVVFPDTATCWHFDDKVAQKYLLEAIQAPMVPTHVFYHREDAARWLASTELPVVAKLRRGAGSYNVQLIRSLAQGRRYCRKAFGRGFNAVPGYFADMGTKVRNIHSWSSFKQKLGRMPDVIRRKLGAKRVFALERGYALFQEFMPGNEYDTRIVVVGDRAWGFRRMVRKNDFRASGSGRIDADPQGVSVEALRIAFETIRKLGAQGMGFDFIKDSQGRPRIVEMSFGYPPRGGVLSCQGYWDSEMVWHRSDKLPYVMVLADLVDAIQKRQSAKL